jgi:hypothetical protein
VPTLYGSWESLLRRQPEGAHWIASAMHCFVLATCSTVLAFPALAGEPFDGRWAMDLSACTGGGPLASSVTVTALSVSWPGAFCAARTSYLVRDIWYVSARCWGEGAISEVPMKLQVRGNRLVLEWGRARREEFRRCP